MKIAAVDPGTRRVGLAISDESETLALALGAVEREGGEEEEAFVARVAEKIREAGAEAVVVGLPCRMDGTEGAAARRARRFAEGLRDRLGVPVEMWDERLTTEEAGQRLRAVRMPRRKKRMRMNVVAAQVILEGYLASRGTR